MATQLSPQMTDEPGVRFGIATAVLVLTFLATGAFHLDPTDTALVAIGVGGVAASRLPLGVAAAVGAIAWAFFTGFDEHAYGELTLAAADLTRLLGFIAATAALAYGVRGLVRTEVEGVRGRG